MTPARLMPTIPTRARRGHARAIEVFLSHRYKSPAINQYFFDLFRPLAEVQFSVDATKLQINVTRLERQIRSADAFVGIYPFPRPEGGSRSAPTRQQLLTASQYFRLEIDLALRCGCPAIVFSDKVYGPALPIPASMMHCEFDSAELLGRGASPSAPAYRHRFSEFLSMAIASMDSRHVFNQRAVETNSAGLLLPPGAAGYSAGARQVIRKLLTTQNFTTVDLDWQAPLTVKTMAALAALDIVVTDIGDWSSGHGLVPYLHGRLVPTIRLSKRSARRAEGLRRTLFGGLNVGYSEDIVDWDTTASLKSQLSSRLTALTEQQRRIGTAAEARDYFLSAARRKEAVFISYSGRDAAIAQPIRKALEARFSRVFDYRDGRSIRPGEPWMDEIFDSLAESAIGIPLLSPEYLKSGYCMKEARFMVDRRTTGRMQVLPLEVAAPQRRLPPWLTDLQWKPWSQLAHASDVVTLVESLLDRRASREPRR